jgi:hypothetical protein
VTFVTIGLALIVIGSVLVIMALESASPPLDPAGSLYPPLEAPSSQYAAALDHIGEPPGSFFAGVTLVIVGACTLITSIFL